MNGTITLVNVSRSFRLLHEHNPSLKETLIRGRRASYTERWALKNVDLQIAAGESVGIVGANGAGKSTLLKLAAGILKPQTGSVAVNGSVASMLELGAGFHPDFTGRENVYINGAIHGLTEDEIGRRFNRIVAFAELSDYIDMPVKTYSSGMQMRLAFSVASHVNPDILLVDEVLAVGDEAFQRKCLGRIFDFKRRGGTLLFVSHDPGIVERVCDRVILIEGGHVVADGPPDEVLRRYHKSLATASEADWDEDDEYTADEFEERRWGSRVVELTKVRLRGDAGGHDRFMSGEAVTIEMEFVAHQRIADPIFGFGVFAVEGPYLFGTNTVLSGYDVGSVDGKSRISFRLNALPLNAGRFAVTVAVVSSDEREIYDWMDRMFEFSVFQDSSALGLIRHEGVWTLEAGEPYREQIG